MSFERLIPQKLLPVDIKRFIEEVGAVKELLYYSVFKPDVFRDWLKSEPTYQKLWDGFDFVIKTVILGLVSDETSVYCSAHPDTTSRRTREEQIVKSLNKQETIFYLHRAIDNVMFELDLFGQELPAEATLASGNFKLPVMTHTGTMYPGVRADIDLCLDKIINRTDATEQRWRKHQEMAKGISKDEREHIGVLSKVYNELCALINDRNSVAKAGMPLSREDRLWLREKDNEICAKIDRGILGFYQYVTEPSEYETSFLNLLAQLHGHFKRLSMLNAQVETEMESIYKVNKWKAALIEMMTENCSGLLWKFLEDTSPDTKKIPKYYSMRLAHAVPSLTAYLRGHNIECYKAYLPDPRVVQAKKHMRRTKMLQAGVNQMHAQKVRAASDYQWTVSGYRFLTLYKMQNSLNALYQRAMEYYDYYKSQTQASGMTAALDYLSSHLAINEDPTSYARTQFTAMTRQQAGESALIMFLRGAREFHHDCLLKVGEMAASGEIHHERLKMAICFFQHAYVSAPDKVASDHVADLMRETYMKFLRPRPQHAAYQEKPNSQTTLDRDIYRVREVLRAREVALRSLNEYLKLDPRELLAFGKSHLILCKAECDIRDEKVMVTNRDGINHLYLACDYFTRAIGFGGEQLLAEVRPLLATLVQANKSSADTEALDVFCEVHEIDLVKLGHPQPNF